MKLRIQLVQRTEAMATPSTPRSWDLFFGPDGEEDIHFVGKGTNPPRHYPVLSLRISQLTTEAIQDLKLGGDYLLTLEPVAKR